MPSFPLDLRFATRSLARRPGFAVAAILTLALGIGATTTIWSFAQGLLWSALPYPEADRLMMVWQDYRGRGGPEREWFSPGNFADYRRDNRTFEDMALFTGWGPTVAKPGANGSGVDATGAENITGALVSHSFFSTLGIEPAAGRDFSPEDDVQGAPRVALLREDLAAAKGVTLGDELLVAGEPHTVVGLVPESFRFDGTAGARIWRPLALDAEAISRNAVFVRAVGRLRDEATLAQAREDLSALAAGLRERYPDAMTGIDVAVYPLGDEVVRDLKPALLTLLAAVAGLLLVAGINVAHLLLARGASRGRELAVRSALGAGRGRLVRQLVLEGVVLAAAGGALGLLVAGFGVDLLRNLIPADLVTGLETISLDPKSVAFAVAVSLTAGIVAGLLPALALTRREPERHLRQGNPIGAGGSPRAGCRLGGALVTVETALALSLLVVASLLVTSFTQLSRVNAGFDPTGLATFSVATPPSQFPDDTTVMGFYDRLLGELAALPGVTAVGAASALPLSEGNTDTTFRIVGRPAPRPGEEPGAWYRQVTPGYLEMLDISILRGRGITTADISAPRPSVPEGADGEPERVAVVVNQAFVATYFPTEDPLGRELALGSAVGTIVGIAADVRAFGLDEEEPPSFYLSLAQVPIRYLDIVVETAGAPETIVPSLIETLRRVDPRVAAGNPGVIAERVRDSVAPQRATTLLGTLFGLAALLLAAVGLYGVVAYATRRRSQEIGVRMALGARMADVVGLVMGQGLAPVAIGLGLGLVGAFTVSRLLTPNLYGVDGFEPLPVVAAVALLAVAAGLALLLPARLAARVDPARTLRDG